MSPFEAHIGPSNDFDWAAYSFDLPNHSPVRHLDSPDNDRISSKQHRGDSSGSKQHIPLKRIKKPFEEMRAKITLGNKRRWLKYKAKFQAKSPEEQKQGKLAERSRQRKYYNDNKRQTGFTTTHNAKMSIFRALEKNGKASQEQLQYLDRDRQKRHRFEKKKAAGITKKGSENSVTSSSTSSI